MGWWLLCEATRPGCSTEAVGSAGSQTEQSKVLFLVTHLGWELELVPSFPQAPTAPSGAGHKAPAPPGAQLPP